MLKSLDEKYKISTIITLIAISGIVNFILVDLYVLPRQIIPDNITSEYEIYKYNSSKFGQSKSLYGYKYYTEKGFEFTTEEKPIEESVIKIEQTKILKNISDIRSSEKDYSKLIVSDLNGPSLYFLIILAISSSTSVIILLKKKDLNKNGFQNIILFNLMMLFFIGFIYYWT